MVSMLENWSKNSTMPEAFLSLPGAGAAQTGVAMVSLQFLSFRT